MILITASQYYQHMDSVIAVAEGLDDEVLLSGKRGPCMYLRKYCRENNIPYRIETAKWQGPKDFTAGKLRNQTMVNILLTQPVRKAILFQSNEPNGDLDRDVRHMESQLEQSGITPDIYYEGVVQQSKIFTPATDKDLGDGIDTNRIS